MPSPFLYLPDDRLSSAELSAARLDGHVVELGDAYIPADAVETAALRAGSLRGLLGEAMAATHGTAAWVHGAIATPPVRHSVQRAVAHRLHHVIHRRLSYSDSALPVEDLQLIGGVLVTTPVRTLADLARRAARQPSAADAAEALAHQDPALVDAARAWFDDHGPVPDKRAALRWLREVAATRT